MFKRSNAGVVVFGASPGTHWVWPFLIFTLVLSVTGNSTIAAALLAVGIVVVYVVATMQRVVEVSPTQILVRTRGPKPQVVCYFRMSDVEAATTIRDLTLANVLDGEDTRRDTLSLRLKNGRTAVIRLGKHIDMNALERELRKYIEIYTPPPVDDRIKIQL